MNTPFEQPQSTRIAWLDTAKLIGIYLVILGHILLYQNKTSFLYDFIYLFHMPLFFFLAGLVEKNRTVKDTFTKCIKTIITPYFWFYLITYPWWLIVTFWQHPELYERSFVEAVIKPAFGLINGLGFSTAYFTTVCGPLWFLIALFWCRLFNALGNHLHPIGKPFMCIIGITISVMLLLKNTFLIFSLGASCMAFPFYYVGTLLQKRIQSQTSDKFFILKRLCVVLICFVIVFFMARFNGSSGINRINYGKNPLYFFIGAFAGIAMLCALAQILPPLHSLGNLLAQNTITILALHTIIYTIIFALYQKIVAPIQFSYIASWCIALLALFICVIPCYVISRWFSGILGRKKRALPSA